MSRKKIPEIIESITTFFKELPDKIKTAISNLKDKIEAWAKDVKQWFKEVLPAILESISIKMATLPMEIYVAIKGLRAKINEIGKLILDGIFEGLARIKEKIKGWKDSFVKGFKDALGIKSPSTVFRDEVGLNMGLGIAEGIDASRSDIVGTATSIANDVQKVFDGIRYNADVDYSLEIQKAVKSGDYALANQLEQQRNAKIQGEGMGYELTFDYEQFSTPIVEGIGETTVAVNQSTTDLMVSATKNMTEQLTNENRVIADLKVHLSNLQATLFGRLQSWFSQTISAINSIRINITYVTNNYSTSKDVKKRATGGFPEMGEMFIANENGAEMIGSVGNRTAVVNNDQIVEAVSTGVARAVQSVMGNREEQPITITLDGEVIYKKSTENFTKSWYKLWYGEVRTMITNGFIKINGVVLPYPATGIVVQRSQFVDSTRNALGQVIAQKINRRIIKFDSLEWKHLTASEWRSILTEIEKFEGTLEYWDNLSGTFKSIKVYWGDASEEVFKIDPDTGEVLEYINCKCNIIDMGY